MQVQPNAYSDGGYFEIYTTAESELFPQIWQIIQQEIQAVQRWRNRAGGFSSSAGCTARADVVGYGREPELGAGVGGWDVIHPR